MNHRLYKLVCYNGIGYASLNLQKVEKILINVIFLFYFVNPIFSQNNMDNKILSEFIIVNEDFEYVLDISIEGYNKCKTKREGHHFEITIGEFEDKEYSGMKSLSISRSFYKDFISNGYGFFYYKGYLFILYGLQLNNIFKKTDNTQTFSYKQTPICIFDPPRWLYCYWNKEFYVVESFPCG